LRRDIDKIANDAASSTKPIEIEDVKLVGPRFRETLEPGLRALESLEPMVGDSEEIEALARALY
jgi:hypothetical protein